MNQASKGITFIIQRHGQAAPGAVDVERSLTELGREQRIAMGVKLIAKDDLTTPALIIASVAKRVVDTVARDPFICRHVQLGELYTSQDEDGATLGALFKELKYSSYRTYLMHDATGAYNRWADSAYRAINTAMAAAGVTSGTVLIGTHAVNANALALKIIVNRIPAASIADSNALLDHCLGECGVIIIRPDGSVEIIELE